MEKTIRRLWHLSKRDDHSTPDILPPGFWENDDGPEGWYAIADADGIKVYAGNERLAAAIADLRTTLSRSEVVRALQTIHDDADHVLGTETTRPVEVLQVNVRAIQQTAAKLLRELNA